jgi:hypothetical protein
MSLTKVSEAGCAKGQGEEEEEEEETLARIARIAREEEREEKLSQRRKDAKEESGQNELEAPQSARPGAPTVAAGEQALEEFAQRWDEQYPRITQSWSAPVDQTQSIVRLSTQDPQSDLHDQRDRIAE